MLNTRMTTILRELIKADTAITGAYLADLIQVTSRTIRNDMKELESLIAKYGVTIQSIRGIGYQINVEDESAFRQLMQEITQIEQLQIGVLPHFPEERVQYLVNRLLLAEGYLKLEDLADEIFISQSTLKNDLYNVKKILGDYGIILEKRPNYGFILDGEEFNLRLAMAECLLNYYTEELVVTRYPVSFLNEEEFAIIEDVILHQLKNYQVTLSDVGLSNLLFQISIAYKRIKSANLIHLSSKELANVKVQKEYRVATSIVEKLEERLDIQFPPEELAYIAIHVFGTRLNGHPDVGGVMSETSIDDEIYLLATQILEAVDSELNIGIQHDKELLLALCLHLKPALNRYRYGLYLRNPILSDIKQNYPIAYQAAIISGKVIQQQLDVSINENELGYLALHIGATIESRKQEFIPKRCLLVCPSGVGSARLLISKLSSKFGRDMDIVGTVPYYKLKYDPMLNLDLIISCIPIKFNFPIPVIQINPIPEEEDFDKIKKVLAGWSDQEHEYLRKELMFLRKTFHSREDVLAFMAKELQNLGLVDESYLSYVTERENFCPTSFGNLVAIPHPIIPQTNSTFWAICTLEKPIDWGGRSVQFICLLNIRKNSTQNMQRMYDSLVNIVENGSLVQDLLKCKSYREFIECI